MGQLRDWVRWPWVVAGIVPVLFVLFFIALAVFADPQHDDFCFSYRYVEEGLFVSVMRFYGGLGGRVLPYVLIEVPAAIAHATGVSLLLAYSVTMTTGVILFVIGCMIAIWRAWPRLRGLPSIFLGIAFAAAIIGASPSVSELLYWLPGVACYVPPAIICILVLGECVRALDNETDFSATATIWMAVGAFIAGLCNEFTTPWIVAILIGSAFARRMLERRMQIGCHLLIAVAALAGWTVVVTASGNGFRMSQMTNPGLFGHSLLEAFRFGLAQLGRFLRDPGVIAWLVAVGALTLAAPIPDRPDHPRARLLAPGLMILCLGCCYFEYFVHYYSTGIRLVERAQNQALILLLFGSGLSVSLLVRTYRQELKQLLSKRGMLLPLNSTALPLALAVVVAASLLLGRTGRLVYAEASSLYPYWRETVARHKRLSTTPDSVVIVAQHRWKPTLLLIADVMVNKGCVARYFGKTDFIVVEAPSE